MASYTVICEIVKCERQLVLVKKMLFIVRYVYETRESFHQLSVRLRVGSTNYFCGNKCYIILSLNFHGDLA